MNRRRFLVFSLAAAACATAPDAPAAAGPPREPAYPGLPADPEKVEPLTLSEDEWKRRLPADDFHVLREEGTERAFTGRYAHSEGDGRYLCAGCGLALFDSKDKFDSGTGWPSYTRPIHKDRVTEKTDFAFGIRTEVECARCGGHLGHVFSDGPRPTGLRYCMNSASLLFQSRA